MPSLRSARWFPADGSDPVVLSDGTWDYPFLAGATGLLAPQVTVQVRQSPGVRGGRFESATVKPSTISLPVLVEGSDRAAFKARRAELIEALDPTAGPGMLELSADLYTGDGDVRCVSAVCLSGLEGDEAPNRSGDLWWLPTVKFQTLDVWQSVEPTIATWAGPVAVPFFPWDIGNWMISPDGVTPVLPLDLDGSATVDNYPTWTLAGPFYRVRIANPRTGLWWHVDRPTVEGETVTVVCDPSEAAVTDDAGSAYGSLVGGSVLWPLRPGDAPELIVQGAGATTLVTLSTPARWLTGP